MATSSPMVSPRPPTESPQRSHGYARQAPSDNPKDVSSERDTRDNKAIAVAVAAAMKAIETEAYQSQTKDRTGRSSNPASPVPTLAIPIPIPVPARRSP